MNFDLVIIKFSIRVLGNIMLVFSTLLRKYSKELIIIIIYFIVKERPILNSYNFLVEHESEYRRNYKYKTFSIKKVLYI